MNRLFANALIAGVGLSLSACATRNSREPNVNYFPTHASGGLALNSTPADSAESLWPQVILNGGQTNFIYEPQYDYWDSHQLTARDAVAVQMTGQAQPIFGVVTIKGLTLVNKATRTVSLENIQILGGDFPSARPRTAELIRLIREVYPKELAGLSLEAMESSLAHIPQPLNGLSQTLNNSPPRIIFSTKPAILVYVDGPPIYSTVAGTSLERVLNSRALLLKDRAGVFYLHVLNGYMKATDLAAPWSVADKPPAGAALAETQALKAATPVDLLDEPDDSTNQPPALSVSTAPLVYVSSKPAELVVFDGVPDFVPIRGTRLFYAKNTTANVFRSVADQKLYVLLSGRWYRGPSQQGPWEFVLADHLPNDFAKIPDESPKENVKASVPGTPQATEALIANSIPESTKVPINTQMEKPQIDGPPRLLPIVGTPLYYVVNSGTPLIRVDDHSWYACDSGVWFTADSLNGPWTVATSVPAVIYTIPASSPLHFVTYVQVFGATPQEVYVGYTPGYLGTEVEDGVVVYGTGYDYPPWVGTDWYGWPCTWGLGWAPCWNPWDDWGFDFGFGWGCGFGALAWTRCHPARPWWGPGRNWHHEAGSVAWRQGITSSTARDVFRPSRGVGMVTRTQSHPASADTYGRAYNSRTGLLAAGQRAEVQNVYSANESQRPGAHSWSAQNHIPQNSPSSARLGEARGFDRSNFSHQSSRPSLGYFSATTHTGGYGSGHSGSSRGSWGGGGGSGGHGGGGGGHSGGGGGHGGGVGGGGGHGGSGR